LTDHAVHLVDESWSAIERLTAALLERRSHERLVELRAGADL
jgi:hypothetical protein